MVLLVADSGHVYISPAETQESGFSSNLLKVLTGTASVREELKRKPLELKSHLSSDTR